MKVFISYSSKSRDLVTELADHLTLIDHDVWFDQDLSRQGGQPWWKRILEQIRACDVFLVALTAAAERSKPCQLELEYALALKKIILPVRLADDVQIAFLPLPIQSLQIVDYREHSIAQLKQLKATMKNLPRPLPLPARLPPEPPTPFDRIALIHSRIAVPSMSADEQKLAARDIEDLIEEGEDNATLTRIIQAFLNRRDLTVKTANKLRELSSELSGAATTRIRRPLMPPLTPHP